MSSKGYEGLFDGAVRTISRDVFDLAIKQSIWQSCSADKTERWLEVVLQRHELQLS